MSHRHEHHHEHERIDSPERYDEVRSRIRDKSALRGLYEEVYDRYRQTIGRCPTQGLIVELGSGAGFARERIPGILTTDVIEYPGLDQVVDATRLPFADASVRTICMYNTFHHIPNVAKFLGEAVRVLLPGGRVLIVDQHPGWLARPIYKFLHHESFDSNATDWSFRSTGPLSSANGALAWIVFRRDRVAFEKKFPGLKLTSYDPHTPLRYWLSGGMKPWTLLPRPLFGLATRLDQALISLSPELGSFVDVELEKPGLQ